MPRLVVIIVLVATGCACAPTLATTLMPGLGDGAVIVLDGGPSCEVCTDWGNPRNGGTVSDRLVELSGLVASRTYSGVLYAHNDSGDSAHFFAMTSGALSEFVLPGATNVDWEDIGLGPCPAGSCVFLADVGDNNFVRTDYAIYRVPEPGPGNGGASDVTWEKFPFQYPAGAKHNAEALFVHPVSGRVYVITKESTGVASEVYRFPELDASKQVTLEKVATLKFPTASDGKVTGADVHPCGRAALFRMYNRVVELRLNDAAADFETVFTLDPVTVTSPQEPQGEAVAYSVDGRRFFTASEKLTEPVTLYEMRCK